MLRTSATHVLFLEDDLSFNRHLVHNLEHWTPISKGFGLLASIYNPGMSMVACSYRDNFSLGLSKNCYGSQALVIARDAIKYVIDHWDESEGMQDLRISRLAANLQPEMFYHSPSLVQHLGKRSTWGGHFHEARDFDKEWKTLAG